MKTKVIHNIRYILNLTFTARLWFVIFVPILSIVIAQRDVAMAWLSALIFNNLQTALFEDHDLKYLRSVIFCAILMFLVFIGEWLLSAISDMIENYWREAVNLKLRKRFMKKDYEMDVAYFDNQDKQACRSMAENVDPVSEVKSVINCVGKLSAAVSFAIIMWAYSPWLIPISIIIRLPVYFLRNKLNSNDRKFRIEMDQVIREKDYYRSIPIDKKDVKEYKVFSMTNFTNQKYRDKSKYYLDKYRNKFAKDAVGNTILGQYDSIVTIAVEIALGISVFMGKTMFGDFTLLIAAFQNLSNSVNDLSEFSAEIKDIHDQNNMLISYLAEHTIYEEGKKNTRLVSDQAHRIEFRDVAFRYPGCDEYVLEHLNMTLEPGKTYGLVGLNGCGKSTIVNLLLRLYEPDQGTILLDGGDIKEYNTDSYYRAVTCVFQSPNKYSMPIRDYICSGKAYDENSFNDALKQVKLDSWCAGLKSGIDAMLTRAIASENESVEPSVGQWQKLSIARAIYKNSGIMVLDEPSASLDVEVESEIFNYIAKLSENKTALLISHRLSSVMDCDEIYLLQNGAVAEQGTHCELMKHGGQYADLFNAQARQYRRE